MKIISQLALGLMVVFCFVLVLSNGGIFDVCNAYAADGADMGITYSNCKSGFAKMAKLGQTEASIVAMNAIIGPLFHAFFFAAGMGSLYCLLCLEAGTKSVAVAHLIHGTFMSTAGLMHANNGGLIGPLGFWPVDANVNKAARDILPPWAIMCSTIGLVCWAAFFVSAGVEGKKAKAA